MTSEGARDEQRRAEQRRDERRPGGTAGDASPPPLPWAHPTMLAPMEGVTHAPLRALLAARGGLGIVCTEFVRITASVPSPAALARTIEKAPGLPLSVQVMGNHVEHMAEAARIVAAEGADVVDVNLGCPMPRIVRKGVGAAMLKDPELLRRVLGAMRERVPGMLSAKIRAGFDRAEDVVDIARVVEESGVDFLVVHPRRRVDLYRGKADWRIVALLVRELRIPVVGNGDLWYAQDALRLQAESGCAAVMIGRPALRNPWIFEQLADLRAGRAPRRPTGSDLLEHLERAREVFEARFRRPIGKMKELLAYVGRAVGDGGDFLRQAQRAHDLDLIMTIARARLAPLGAGALDLDAPGSLGLEARPERLDVRGEATLAKATAPRCMLVG